MKVGQAKLTFSQKDTLLALIENSIGTKLFQSLIFKDDSGQTVDILEKGNLSCTYYVSSLLVLVDYLDKPHATVTGLLEKLSTSKKFKSVKENFEPGDILFWENTIESNGHPHVGFYLKEGLAVSNSSTKSIVDLHHYTYGQSEENPLRNVSHAFRTL